MSPQEVTRVFDILSKTSEQVESLKYQTGVALERLNGNFQTLTEKVGVMIERLDDQDRWREKTQTALAIMSEREAAEIRANESAARIAEQRSRDEAAAKAAEKRGELLDKIKDILRIPGVMTTIMVLGLALVAAVYFAGGVIEFMRAVIAHWK